MQVGLDWLLKMQRSDGAVYRKLAGKQWAIKIPPDEDTQPRYLYGISTPETAKLAAVLAIASRIYQTVKPELATKYLDAAESAWQYLQTESTMKVDWRQGDDTGSIKYLASEFDTEESLKTDIDDRLWAAVELYITTGKQDFADYFAANFEQTEYSLFSWKNPVPLALINYLQQDSQPTSVELIAQIKTRIEQRADLVLAKVKTFWGAITSIKLFSPILVLNPLSRLIIPLRSPKISLFLGYLSGVRIIMFKMAWSLKTRVNLVILMIIVLLLLINMRSRTMLLLLV